MNVDKQTVTRNLAWAYAERMSSQGISFIISLVLARLLSPDEYGIIAIVLVFINICEVFISHGFNTALIQKQDADSLDYNTNQVLCFITSLLLYFALFISAPPIASFYKLPELTPIIRIMGIRVIIGSVNAVQRVVLEKAFAFKKLFVTSLLGVIASGAVGIIMAYRGAGIWALVVQNMTNVTIYTLALVLVSSYRFRIEFSHQRARTMMKYGWKLIASGLLNSLYNDTVSLLVGKVFSPAALAIYDRGNQIPKLVVNNINTSIDKVLFPALSTMQTAPEHMKKLTRRAVKTSSYVLCPVLLGIAACAEPLILVLLTDKWGAVVPYLQILCVGYMFMPIHTANLQAIKAIGRSDIYLKVEIVKKIYAVLFMLISILVLKSVKAVAYSMLLTSVISCFVNAFPSKKLINYSYREQASDILPNVVIAVIMGAPVWLVNLVPIGNLYKLLIEIPLGIVLYVILSIISKNDSYLYLKATLSDYAKRKNRAKPV